MFVCWLQETRRAYRELFFTAPIGEAGISGAILFKETLQQSAADGTPFVECLRRQGVMPGIKVDEVGEEGPLAPTYHMQCARRERSGAV